MSADFVQLAPQLAAEIPPRLLAWWDAGHDSFPWRAPSDPYDVWVSEVMLQQTQVTTVVPYYERWMERFPTVASLAAAPLGEVLLLWQGLGYYSRARNLHKAARQVMDELDGRIPAEPEKLRALPGIGRYTAGAIASIAFGLPAAVLDGNVIRVMARVLDLSDDVTRSATRRLLWQWVDALVPAERAGEYNQALMELGRKTCRPVKPLCRECPLADLCLSHRRGTQQDRPVRPPRKRAPHYVVTAGVIWRDGRVLVTQRPLDSMLGGLWEFPGGKLEPNESLPDCLRREIREELDFDIQVGAPLTVIEHAYTHFRITLHVFQALYLSGEPRPVEVADLAWVEPSQLDAFPFPVTDLKIVALVQDLPAGVA